MRLPRQFAATGLALVLLSCVLAFGQETFSKKDFEISEGHFHDGLGTYTELVLANALIAQQKLAQPPFDVTRSRHKMQAAIDSLPESHPSRTIFPTEIANIEKAVPVGAAAILTQARGNLIHVRHTALEFADAHAGDLRLEFSDRAPLPISVKTDKSNWVAVAEGQTPDIAHKWAERYFRVSEQEMNAMLKEFGFASLAEAKADYLNIAAVVAQILISKLELKNCEPTDFKSAQVGNIEAAKYLLRQLRHYKHGNDNSRVIIFDRKTGGVKWDSLLDAIELETLTAGQISFLPAHPRKGHRIASEFGIKIDGQIIVSFQIKHKRGKARGTERQNEFSDITTRLRI